MSGKSPGNARTKRDYYHHLKHALGRSDQTIRQIARSLARFESFTGRQDFKSFDQRRAVGFKECLTKAGLAPATIHSCLNDLKLFFGWLALQAGFKRAIRLADIDYFNLSEEAVQQDPKEVSTKFSKRIDTFLFPLNNGFEAIFLEWITY